MLIMGRGVTVRLCCHEVQVGMWACLRELKGPSIELSGQVLSQTSKSEPVCSQCVRITVCTHHGERDNNNLGVGVLFLQL